MKELIYICIIFFSYVVSVSAQISSDLTSSSKVTLKERRRWQYGLRMDVNSVYETVMLGSDDYNPEYINRFHTYSGYSLSPFGIYIPVRYNHNNLINFEVRPGIVMSGELLSSIEFGFNCYCYPIIRDIYFVSGFTFSKHTEFLSEPPHYHPILPVKRSVYWSEFYTSISLGVGFQIGTNTAIDLTVLKTLNEEYAGYKFDGLSVINHKFAISDGEYPNKLKWMFKVGFNFYH